MMTNTDPAAKCGRCSRPCPVGASLVGQAHEPDPLKQWFRRSWTCGHPELTCGPCLELPAALAAGCAECGCEEEYT